MLSQSDGSSIGQKNQASPGQDREILRGDKHPAIGLRTGLSFHWPHFVCQSKSRGQLSLQGGRETPPLCTSPQTQSDRIVNKKTEQLRHNILQINVS